MKIIARIKYQPNLMLNIAYSIAMGFIFIIFISFPLGIFMSNTRMSFLDIIEGIPFCIIFVGALERLIWFWFFCKFPKQIDVYNDTVYLRYYFGFQTKRFKKIKVRLVQKHCGNKEYFILKTGFMHKIAINDAFYEYNRANILSSLTL